MSYVAPRTTLDTSAPNRGGTVSGASLLPASVLSGLAALLALSWWQQDAAVPLSWQRPPLEALFLLPAAPVVGLLALRLVVSGRSRTVTGQHLMRWTARWAGAWAVATAVGLVLSVQGLYGVPLVELGGVDHPLAVVTASDSFRAQLSLLWVSLLLALFADRLSGWRDTIAALLLTGTALLAGAPVGPATADAPTGASHAAVMVVAAVQLVAVAVWLGALAAVVHLRTPPGLLQHHLTRLGALASAAAVALGAAVVVARMLAPGQDTPVAIAVAQLVGIAMVAAVGYRHRAQTVEPVASGRPLLLLGLVVGELMVLAALVMMGGVLPVAF